MLDLVRGYFRRRDAARQTTIAAAQTAIQSPPEVVMPYPRNQGSTMLVTMMEAVENEELYDFFDVALEDRPPVSGMYGVVSNGEQMRLVMLEFCGRRMR